MGHVVTSSRTLFVHCVHLNTVLEMCCCVHFWPQDDDINLGHKISSDEGQNTEKRGKHLSSHGEGFSVDEVQGEEAYPGDLVHHQAEGDTLGLIVIGWQVFAHVAEGEAEDTEKGYVRQLHARAQREGFTTLQNYFVWVEIKVLGRPRSVQRYPKH